MNRKRRCLKSKPKKPKYLSLRHQFPPNETKCSTAAVAGDADSRQLNLFPLHPENDGEIQDQAENVALFFSAADAGASTLTGLLDNSAAAESISSHADNNSSRVEYLEDRAALVRNALRSREHDSSDEKWVCYSEVVERKVKEEEVTSSAVDHRPPPPPGRVSLKLDYEEIINAWSNKGPLYIDTCSHIVPDVNYDGGMWGCNVGLWTVPEMVLGDDTTKNEEEIKSSVGNREASVLRYKEKRRNRLFSKKIRYQVRKLNAESRPRLKFVDRICQEGADGYNRRCENMNHGTSWITWSICEEELKFITSFGKSTSHFLLQRPVNNNGFY